ncbi:hypothetical protein SAMN02910293_00674 [Streptococcus henryi]|uniref:Uncharacterized protein n=1 Tax=Streptococcus henryi TaxID=439219 RepID=A0A1G6AXD1_9STRE|nr:hypothetical protein [Streptococcus henryi]SDB13067.1 hypothetical protein SAMN02910293_00674 [Streptococcus henryi]
MKNKPSLIIYALIGSTFAGLSVFTNLFEIVRFESIFSHMGQFIGVLISASILISITKSIIKELWN